MRKLQSRYREAARRLLRLNGAEEAPDPVRSATAVFEALDPELSNLVTGLGARALEGRAIRLAREAHPVLGPLDEARNGERPLHRLAALRGEVEPDELEAAVVELVARLVALLSSLLGDQITFRLLRRACPDVELEDVMREASGGAE